MSHKIMGLLLQMSLDLEKRGILSWMEKELHIYK